MTGIPGILIRIYRFLLQLYPAKFRSEFEEQMLLDFSDMAADVRQKGRLPLVLFCLHELIDFPINLIRAHSREGHMTPVFHSGPVRGAFQGAVALGLACAATMSIVHWILITMEGQGWLFLLRIANSHGWHLNYNALVQIISYFSASLVGALLAGILLALCFRETSHLKRYFLLGMLGWAAPLVLARILGLLLKTNSEMLRNTVSQYSWILLAGLGFGAVFSLILQDRKKTPWLLLAGSLGYLIVAILTIWIVLALFPKYMTGPSIWIDLASTAGVHGITGIVLGAILGTISGWSRHKIVSA